MKYDCASLWYMTLLHLIKAVAIEMVGYGFLLYIAKINQAVDEFLLHIAVHVKNQYYTSLCMTYPLYYVVNEAPINISTTATDH